MREVRLYDSLSGELVAVSPADAIRVEVRASPVVMEGALDVGSTRPFVLFSFLERYLRREGLGSKFLFNSPGVGDALYEVAEGDGEEDVYLEDDDDCDRPDGERRPGRARAERADGGEPDMALLPVSRSDVDRWVNVCFGADRQGREWPPAAPDARVALNEALKVFGHEAVALYLLGTHYSQPLGDAHTGLTTGARHARRIREATMTLAPGRPSPREMRGYLDRFHDALADDLDTPNAFVAMFEWILDAERRGGVGDRDLRTMLETFELDDLLAPAAER